MYLAYKLPAISVPQGVPRLQALFTLPAWYLHTRERVAAQAREHGGRGWGRALLPDRRGEPRPGLRLARRADSGVAQVRRPPALGGRRCPGREHRLQVVHVVYLLSLVSCLFSPLSLATRTSVEGKESNARA